ncbi:MAG: glycoside hydrolase, family 38 [Acidimicrobiales bacterium]|nr:glycoside hydrolase, family 38 [Acidimicrobiales bacterium]
MSHTHWDREWYRTFQAFRARLVDTIDRVLELLDADPGWSFVLDGQAAVLEDYVAVRPGRADALKAACRAGRIGIGPWYVQPDSLLPSGESHVRNLLEGRRVASEFGPVSRVAYTPDSFGHPAQFPQLFTGFGLDGFVYWRGNGNEIDRLPATYRWIGPDGSSMTACHLGKGYFGAAYLPDDVDAAVVRLRRVVEALAAKGDERVLLMNGVDHAGPDAHTAAVAEALAAATGWKVGRGLLDDFVDGLDVVPDRFEHRGELMGARTANLLPGVWSSRLPLKLLDRRAEAALVGWAEPWVALGRRLGAGDEAPSLRIAWRELLANQAHDSIGGCSAEQVHEQMLGRYATAIELAEETTGRVLERLAGLPTDRRPPFSDELDVAVFNPSPFARTDVVRIRLDGVPTFLVTDDNADVHPLAMASLMRAGFTVDGQPARVVPSSDPNRFRILPEQQPWDVEVIVGDVPAFGWRRLHLAPGDASPDTVDDGHEIAAGDVSAVADETDGTLTVRVGARTWTGLLAVEDVADVGDTYDFDPVADDDPVTRPATVTIERRRHPSGIAELAVTRMFERPTGRVEIRTTVRLAAGIDRIDVDVDVDNQARDHRLRLLFPTGRPVDHFHAATTFDTAHRSTAPADDSGWVHAAPRTFPHQGWVSANGLTVAAPGLPEAEVTPDGTIAITVVRAVAWLARLTLSTRPIPAGPGLPTPGAQCIGPTRARISLFAGDADPGAVRAAELGLRAVPAGPAPLLPPDTSAFALDGPVVLSALKPAAVGDGLVARVLNPTHTPAAAVLRLSGPPVQVTAVRVDETPSGSAVAVDDDGIALDVPPHALRSVLVR